MKNLLGLFTSLLILTVLVCGCTSQPAPDQPTPIPTVSPHQSAAPSTPAPAPSLVGVTWQLTGYNDLKGAWSSVIAGSTITATFNTDGKIAGSAGCNQYNANYQVTGSSIWISQPASTMMMCSSPTGVMHQESSYLMLLTVASTYSISGDQLTIYDASGGKKVLQYKIGKATSSI